MTTGRKAELIWTVVWIAFALTLYAMSSGEPVCQGPLITQVNDSFPPECPSPAVALPLLVGIYIVGLAVILGYRALSDRRS